MGKDRRSYHRLSVETPANVYFGDGYLEHTGTILNISEHGFLFLTDKRLETHPPVGSPLVIEFVDSYYMGSSYFEWLMQKNCIVRHVENIGDASVIGCYLSSRSFSKYVRDLELKKYSQCLSGIAL